MKGQQPSSEESFYYKWAQESPKDNLVLVNDVLRQLITISAALLGVSIFYESVLAYKIVKLSVILSFMTSLISALYGILPYEESLNTNDPNKIKIHKLKALSKKRKHLWISALSLTFSFVIIILMLIIKILF